MGMTTKAMELKYFNTPEVARERTTGAASTPPPLPPGRAAPTSGGTRSAVGREARLDVADEVLQLDGHAVVRAQVRVGALQVAVGQRCLRVAGGGGTDKKRDGIKRFVAGQVRIKAIRERARSLELCLREPVRTSPLRAFLHVDRATIARLVTAPPLSVLLVPLGLSRSCRQY